MLYISICARAREQVKIVMDGACAGWMHLAELKGKAPKQVKPNIIYYDVYSWGHETPVVGVGGR